jgi:hypothetical protein
MWQSVKGQRKTVGQYIQPQQTLYCGVRSGHRRGICWSPRGFILYAEGANADAHAAKRALYYRHNHHQHHIMHSLHVLCFRFLEIRTARMPRILMYVFCTLVRKNTKIGMFLEKCGEPMALTPQSHGLLLLPCRLTCSILSIDLSMTWLWSWKSPA